MDIALIIHELLMEGGGERQFVSLARALSLRGHAVTIYTAAYNKQACFTEICHSLTIRETGRGRFPWLKRPRFLRAYLDMLRMAAVVKDKHEVWNPHHWPAQWAAVWLKRRLGGSVVWMCNDVPDFFTNARTTSLWNPIRRATQKLYYLFDHRQNRKIDMTMFLSRWAEREFCRAYETRTCVVRSGADPLKFFPGGDRKKIRTRFGYSERDFVLLWLGIFMPHRRLEDAIVAVHRVRSRGVNVHLLMAGSDRCYPGYVRTLKDLVQALGMTSFVSFSPKVEDREIRDFYAACDVFVFPNDQQTWGLVVLEALACGCPALVSTGAGVHEVLQDGNTATFFPPKSPAVLAEKILQLAADGELRETLARNGMQLARERYNWDRFSEQVQSICEQVLRDKAAVVAPLGSSSSLASAD
jgi:glycosyltransferase involved in cell wall biosynthesis